MFIEAEDIEVMPLYTITKAMPKDGFMRAVHNKVINTKCKILVLEPKTNALLYYQLKYEPNIWHHVQTSTVREISQDENGVITFTTNNTDYVLEPCKEVV